jgi:aspartate racemase
LVPWKKAENPPLRADCQGNSGRKQWGRKENIVHQPTQKNRAFTIGIITGSGPEAGLDLWGKILQRNQLHRGNAFSGDLDAPRVVIVSEPQLGLSMDLAANNDQVWDSLRQTIMQIAPQVDAYAIACNTLNWYQPQIETLQVTAEFISFQTVLQTYIKHNRCRKIGLLGAAPVMDMGAYSAYRSLAHLVEVEIPSDPAALHALIHDVKRLGSSHPSLAPRFAEILAPMQSEQIFLACTELPLISGAATPKHLVDVTALVADTLAVRALEAQKGGKG